MLLVVASGGAPIALAADVDRVQVGAPGRNTTRGFSPQTHVVVTSPETYARTSFDGDSGNWRGPICVVSPNPSLNGEVRISWSVDFSDAYPTAEEAADRGRRFRDLPTVSRGTLAVPHRIRGKNVGGISANYVLGQSSAEDAWAEIGLGIPITRGVTAIATFWSSGPSFDCNVGGTTARQWHQDAVEAAAAAIVVDGNLPPAHLTAHGQRRHVAGFLTDGFGHPVVGARVAIARKVGRSWRRSGSATTNASGFYRALALPGLARAEVGSLRSRPVRVG